MLSALEANRITSNTGVVAEEASAADAVLGVVPGAVAYPRTIEEVSRVLRWANEQGLKVTPYGTRSKLDRGSVPSGCDILLDLRGLSGVIEHTAGDMTVQVLAGTKLD